MIGADAVPLLAVDGAITSVPLEPPPNFRRPGQTLPGRIAYAAAHVVPKPWGRNVPGAPADIDWDETLAFRHHLWSWGLGVADAMDTAQRNMGLDMAATRELISRSAAEARSVGGRLVVGVNTDHLDGHAFPLEKIIGAYREQLEFAEDVGAGVVLMASRQLAHSARGAEDYRRVYREVLASAGAPVLLHWLGAAFDPTLAGYFGAGDPKRAADTVVDIIETNADRISGIKMSLLDADAEIALRRRLPPGIRMYTGDDYNYVRLLLDDEEGKHSDALLGAFAAVAPNASAALRALDLGDLDGYHRILDPTEALSRQIFSSPTFYYKTGIAFLAWLNGHQAGFGMVGGLHSARSLPHLSEIVRLANSAGALEKPELALDRWRSLLVLQGIDAPSASTLAGGKK